MLPELQEQRERLQDLQNIDWRGKRHRIEESNEALARALLETVRQALDDDGGGADADVHAVTTTTHELQMSHGSRRAPRNSGAYHATRTANSIINFPFLDSDPEPVAYVRVDGQVHEPFMKRHRKWPAAQIIPAEEPRQLTIPASTLAFNAAWLEDPAALMAWQSQLLEQEEMQQQMAAAAAGGVLTPHAESPSHGSAYTNLEAGEAAGGEFGYGDCRDAGGGGTPERGVVDRAEHISTDDGYDGPVGRRRQSIPKSGIPGGPCAHCGTTESPQWRRPLTKKVVLCNACGIYFSRHHSLPKRKKLAGGGAQAIIRSSKVAQAVSLKQPVPTPLSIICEERLEEDEDAGAPQSTVAHAAPCRGDVAGLALHPHRKRQVKVLSASLISTEDPAAHPDGLAMKVLEPKGGHAALSLPVMTALPVVGGINVLVQAFLKSGFCDR